MQIFLSSSDIESLDNPLSNKMHDVCSICLTALNKHWLAQVVIINPCEHPFHHACIDRWLSEKVLRQCPLCKSKIPELNWFDLPAIDLTALQILKTVRRCPAKNLDKFPELFVQAIPLKKLDLSSVLIGQAQSWRLLLVMLKSEFCQVEELILKNNRLDAKKVSQLSRVLQGSSQLKRLQLLNNWAGNEGAQALADLLAVSRNLQILGLTRNRIGNTGAVMLAQSLQNNHHLQKLLLWKNPIDDQGLNAFIELLKGHNAPTGLFELGVWAEAPQELSIAIGEHRLRHNLHLPETPALKN